MEMNTLTTGTSSMTIWKPTGNISPKRAGKVVCSFLDTATTSMGRATHYNTREEQQAAEMEAHQALLKVSRDLYTVMLALPGVTDRSVQVGMKILLSSRRNGSADEFLTPTMERAVLYHLIQTLPVPRMLRLIQAFRIGSEQMGLRRANNSRTRKLILRTLLGSRRLQLWSVKYRRKMRDAFVHAWGKKDSSIIREILAKDGRRRNQRERRILRKEIARFAGDGNFKTACECVGFVLGVRDRLSLPLFKAFEAAKTDLKAGARLPMEVLEGIRSVYHSDVAKDDVLRLAVKKGSLTEGQRMTVQKRAKGAKVEVKMDPTRYDPVKLYIYAFEMGADDKIIKALDQKARKAAAGFPTHYGKVGIVVDASASMAGHRTQKLRPMAATLALRDMLQHVGTESVTQYIGGRRFGDWKDPVQPMGDTALAEGLVEVLDAKPDVVFILSDGYENAPAGRFAEVMEQVRDIGIKTPVYHLNPVFASESKGVRELDAGRVPTMPVKTPAALGTTIIRGLIENEPLIGINALVRMALTSGPVEMRPLLTE
jgi:hypothetical protein